MTYEPVLSRNQLILGDADDVVVVTGWTVIEAVAKRLERNRYTAIGHLHSPTRGISIIIRNLLANPQVRNLLVLDATQSDHNAGGCQCLVDFFKHGVESSTDDLGRPIWRVVSPVVGFIDAEIPLGALNELRRDICVHICAELSQVSQKLPQQSTSPITRVAQEFPMPAEPQFAQMPGPQYGHVIRGCTIGETWLGIIHRIVTSGTTQPVTAGFKRRELINLTAVVTDQPDGFYAEDYLAVDEGFVQKYISQILDNPEQQPGVKYTYGNLLRSDEADQIQQVIDKLREDPNSYSAVMSLWHPKFHVIGSGPCLNHIWVRVVGGVLSLVATFRSNEMFSAWPANAYGLRALQVYIRDAVDPLLVLGPLVTNSLSAHIDDSGWPHAQQLIKRRRRTDFNDESGNFVISADDSGVIDVQRVTVGSGIVVDCFSGQSARKLMERIATDCPALETSHALYLGAELQRAELQRGAYKQL